MATSGPNEDASQGNVLCPVDSLTCSVCSEKFRSYIALLNHVRSSHYPAAQFECRVCDYTDVRTWAISAHYTTCLLSQDVVTQLNESCSQKQPSSSRQRTLKVPYPPELRCGIDARVTSRLTLSGHLSTAHHLSVEWLCSLCEELSYPSISSHYTRSRRCALAAGSAGVDEGGGLYRELQGA